MGSSFGILYSSFIIHHSSFALWAVHISDGVLTWPWLAGGFVVAAALAFFGAWRIRDEEIPQVALLTAAFFVASLVHVSVGPTSVHLLLNGLIGLVLGRRACLAIPLGLFLQAALFQHGGFTTLGVNSCIMVLPALLAWQLFAVLQRVPWLRQPWFRAGLISGSALVWTLSLVYSVVLLCTNPVHLNLFSTSPVAQWDALETASANRITFHPATLAAALALALLAAWVERRVQNAPEFPLGLLVGETAVLATIFLNWLVLSGQQHWHFLALVIFVAHLPIAVVEGIVLGFTVGFLVRVKPALIGWTVSERATFPLETIPASPPPARSGALEKTECSVDPLP